MITRSKTQKPIEKDLIEKTKKTESRGRDHDGKIVLQSSQETNEKKRRDQDTKIEALDWQIWDNSKDVFLAFEVVEELRSYQRA